MKQFLQREKMKDKQVKKYDARFKKLEDYEKKKDEDLKEKVKYNE